MFEEKVSKYTYFKISKDWENDDFSVITVTIKIPENVPDRIKQERINYLYDILKPKQNPK